MTWVLHVARKTNEARSVHWSRQLHSCSYPWEESSRLTDVTWDCIGATVQWTLLDSFLGQSETRELTVTLVRKRQQVCPTLRKICNWESSKYQHKLSRWRTVTHPKIKLSITLILHLSHGNKNSRLLHMKDLSPRRFFFDPRLIHVAIKHNNLINTRNKRIKFLLLHVSA
jgi:hypothetical protein